MEIGASSSLASHDSGIDLDYGGRSAQEPDTSLSDDSSLSEAKSEKSEHQERSLKRRRSPPKTNFDINDNSLLSVYAFFKTFLGASSASTVAIDNKIEQAMDLVKSHLMFAVREEVEVLKEKILELMEQINSLEYENQVLRQYAPQEALQSLPPKKREGGGGSQPQS